MRRLATAACAASALLALTAGAPAMALSAPAAQSSALGRYIVVLEDGLDATSVAAQHARTFGLTTGHVFGAALDGYSATIPAAAVDLLRADPRVKYVQADKQVSATAQSMPTGIDRADADLSPTAAINGTDTRVNVDVAVIDTGVDLDHPDLNVNRSKAKNCSLALSADDDHGHGSHVAGTIGAIDNTNGVVGMAPGARIWPVKVLNAAGMGFTSDIICGIDYVRANAASIEVANMSLGGEGTDTGNCGRTSGDAQHEAICDAVAAGVTFVVAAGNDSADAKNFTPAAYDEVITVSALADFNGKPGGGAPSTCRADQDDTLADYSNYGADVDLIAPGTCINSTWMNGGYKSISGTSMASPHVAGGAALYKAKNPSATPAQVKAALQSSGTLDWNDSDDPDPTKEKLLNVASY